VIAVHVVSVSQRGTVRKLRRVVVKRDRLRALPELGVVITRGGDLAWLYSTLRHGGRVVVQRRAGRARPVAATTGYGLVLEDRRTLRWTNRDGTQGFFDLQHRACPSRSRFRPLLSTDRVAITKAYYGDEEQGATVIRGCDLATGRDLVVGQAFEAFPDPHTVTVIGVDRTWVLIARSDYARPEPCATSWVQTVDVAGGRRSGEALLSDSSCNGPGITAPVPGTPFAITDRGAAAWIAGDADQPRLVAAARSTMRELDRAATIADLRADADTITWTHDGIPRRAVP
jgi:hypothetical protein